MANIESKKVKIFEGIEVKSWIWLTIALSNETVKTLFSFSAGVAVGEIATGHLPIFGASATIIITVLKNNFAMLMEWKAKNDTPPNSTTVTTTEINKDKSIVSTTETQSTTTP